MTPAAYIQQHWQTSIRKETKTMRVVELTGTTMPNMRFISGPSANESLVVLGNNKHLTPAEHLCTHWQTHTDAQLAAALNVATSTIRGRRRRLGHFCPDCTKRRHNDSEVSE